MPSTQITSGGGALVPTSALGDRSAPVLDLERVLLERLGEERKLLLLSRLLSGRAGEAMKCGSTVL
jgi:hypothetical protein